MNFDEIKETSGDSEEEQMVFHYNRQERIKKAPKIVQDYYAGELKAFKPGLFKALVATRANRFMLLTLVICLAVVLITGFFNKRNEDFIDGVNFSLSAFSFEENVYVSLSFADPEKKYTEKNPVPADVIVSFLDADKMTVEVQKIPHVYEGKKSFVRTIYHDYDIFYVSAQISFLGKTKELIAQVEKK